MNEKNETTGGEHNAKEILDCLGMPKGLLKERPIKIHRDVIWHTTQNTEDNTTTSRTGNMMGVELELSLPEALRVVEATVKFLNQTKNEGRQEIRTLKDKENQKIVDGIKQFYKQYKESEDAGFNRHDGSYIFLQNLIHQTLGKDIKDL